MQCAHLGLRKYEMLQMQRDSPKVTFVPYPGGKFMAISFFDEPIVTGTSCLHTLEQ